MNRHFDLLTRSCRNAEKPVGVSRLKPMCFDQQISLLRTKNSDVTEAKTVLKYSVEMTPHKQSPLHFRTEGFLFA